MKIIKMKPTPLKNKGQKDLLILKDKYVYFHYDKDIKSAVGWLKKEDEKIYKEISKLIKDVHGGIFSKVIVKFIRLNSNRNKAFEDVIKK